MALFLLQLTTVIVDPGEYRVQYVISDPSVGHVLVQMQKVKVDEVSWCGMLRRGNPGTSTLPQLLPIIADTLLVLVCNEGGRRGRLPTSRPMPCEVRA